MAFSGQSCPGSRSVKDPRPEYVSCNRCGTELEVWSDEPKTTCPKCSTVYFKEQDLSCIEWCSFARQCIGDDTYERLMANRQTGDGSDREKQVAKARAKLKALIEGKACKIGGEILESR